MPNFTKLLNALCNIQAKTLTTTNYEQVDSWTTIGTDIPTRKDTQTSASISDIKMRSNTDDDMFFFNPDVEIVRGNRIVFLGENYDVIKVNPVYDANSIHHLEVLARIVDHY